MKKKKTIVALGGEALIDSQVDFLRKYCGIEAKIKPKKSTEENLTYLDELENQFWEKVENDAQQFINILENLPALGEDRGFIRETGIFGTDEKGKPIQKRERVLYPTSLLSMRDLHPYSIMLIAARVNKLALSKNASKNVAVRHERDKDALKGPIENIRKEWASGNYRYKRNLIREKWKVLGFPSEDSAVKALRGQPDPNPWPAKYK